MPAPNKSQNWASIGLQAALVVTISAGIRGLVSLYQSSRPEPVVEHPELLPPDWRVFTTQPAATSAGQSSDSVMGTVAGIVFLAWLGVYWYASSWNNFLLAQALRNYGGFQIVAAILMSANPISSIWFWFGVLCQVAAIMSIVAYFGWILLLLKVFEGAVDAIRGRR